MTKDFTNRQGGGRQKLNKLRRKVGAILIEFAFAIPVFLVLIYYIHDLPKQKLMQRKMQFVAYETAAILQSMAVQRSAEGKLITLEDIKKAPRLSYLSFYPGNTMLNENFDGSPLGYFPRIQVYYAVGTGVNRGKVVWIIGTNRDYSSQVHSTDSTYTALLSCKGVELEASSIYPSLKINRDEVKIIVECGFHLFEKDTARGAFNFLFLSPKKYGKLGQLFFPAIAIFTPVGNAFSERIPK